MKILRPFAAVLFMSALGLAAVAQESSEVSSLRAKAVRGNGIAQYNLGLAYAQGRGIAADPIEAFVWLSLARDNGARGRDLDNVVGTLDRAGLETAQLRLAERKVALGARAPGSASATAQAKAATAEPAPAAVAETRAPAAAAPTEDPALATLRAERDALAVRVNTLSGNLADLRAEQERLARLVVDNEKSSRETRQAAEARITELSRNLEATQADLAKSRQQLAALEQAPKPVADTAALDAKTRELQAVQAELEASRNFGRKVEETLNQVNDDRARVAKAAATELEEARRFGQQVEATLNRVNDEKAALTADLAQAKVAAASANASAQELARVNAQLAGSETALAQTRQDAEKAQAARHAVPAYPDLRDRVASLESDLAVAQKSLAAKPAAPSYPDLSGRVRELETAQAALSAEASRAKQEVAALSKAKEDANLAAQTQVAGLVAERDRLAADLSAATAAKTAALAQAAAPKPAAAPTYPDLSGRVRELEAQAATAADSSATALAKSEQARTELARQFDDYKSANATAQRERTSLQASLKMQESEKVALRRQMESATAETVELRTQVASLKAQAAAPKPAAAPAYPDLSGRVSELETALSAEASRARQEVAALTKAKEEASQAAQTQVAGLIAERDRLAADLSATTTAKTAALAQVAAAPAYPDLRDRVAGLESDLAAAQKSLAEKPAAPSYPDLSGRVNELGSEVARLNADRERLEQLLATAGRQQRDATAAAGRIKELEGQVAGLQTSLNAKADAPAHPDLSGRVAELETRLADSNAALQKATGAGEETAQLRRERDELSGRTTELASEVAQLRADRERMQQLLADTGRQLRDGTADAARLKELETQLAASAAETSRTKQELAALTLAMETAATQPAAPAADAGTQAELRETIARLEREKAQLSALATAPAYPDLTDRVRELERQLASAPFSSPDLSGRVGELETALADTRAQLAAQTAEATRAQLELTAATQVKPVAPAESVPVAPVVPAADTAALEQKLADTEDRLATALRGYAELQREHDARAEDAGKAAAAVTAERDALAGQIATLTTQVGQLRAGAQASAGSNQAELARLNESVAALQRASAQTASELAATRALAQQLQGANAVLAGENFQLKTMLARSAGAPPPVAAPVTPAAARTHVVVAGDSLSRLSQRYYGTAGRWQEIYNANTALLGPNGVLRVGSELRIP